MKDFAKLKNHMPKEPSQVKPSKCGGFFIDHFFPSKPLTNSLIHINSFNEH